MAGTGYFAGKRASHGGIPASSNDTRVFPGEDYDYGALQKKEPSFFMIFPVLILTILSVVIGLLPEGVIGYLSQIIEKIV